MQPYWTALDQVLIGTRMRVGKAGGPAGELWANVSVDGKSISRQGFELLGYTNAQGQYVSVGLVVRSSGKKYFGLLHAALYIDGVANSDSTFSPKWTDDPSDKNGQTYITVDLRNTDPTNQALWGTQHKWMRDNLQRFVDEFEPRLKNL